MDDQTSAGDALGPEAAASDAELLSSARAGAPSAIAELYDRHRAAAWRFARTMTDETTAEDVVAEAFTKVFAALRKGRGPAGALRPYLFSAIRNAYVDRVRGERRIVWVDDHDQLDRPHAGTTPEEMIESQLLATAYRSLPERWQTVLWHTAVEGEDHATVGRLLGISPNAVAATAFRAREGLRRGYLAAHLGAARDPECRATREQLPALIRGKLGRRQRQAAERHLETCEACARGHREVLALNERLGAVLAPALLGAGVLDAYVESGVVPAESGVVPAESGSPEEGGATRLLRSRAGRAATVGIAAAVAALVTVGSLAAARSGLFDTDVRDDQQVLVAPTEVAEVEPSAPPSGEPSTEPSPQPSARPAQPRPSTPADAPSAPLPAPLPVPSAVPAVDPPTVPPPAVAPPSDQPEPPAQPPVDAAPPKNPPKNPPKSPPAPPAEPPLPPGWTDDDLVVYGHYSDFGAHRHLQLHVRSGVPGAVLVVRVPGLRSFSVHDESRYLAVGCAGGAAPDEIVCRVGAATGELGIDVVVDGPVVAEATIGAERNRDPHPADNRVALGG
ncbi:sigma-70 family RNA polymerase sigma factor [Nocardioides sp. SYSU DS0663]|uniref:sigma-70 family RNA polymerase sigma factor n=1 Tax=Nocardioides sp. SYSU DS0663 TaxID=3416445 RepID=UPI003F4B72CB